MKHIIDQKNARLKPAYAVFGARVQHVWSKAAKKSVRRKGKWQIVYGELGQGDCCCYEPEEAYYIFKTRGEAEAKARWLSGYDDIEVRRVGIATIPSKKDPK